MKTILYTFTARFALRRLPAKARAAIEAKLTRYAETGAGKVDWLTARPGKKLRVGDFRVIFAEDGTSINVLDLCNRRDIYD